MQKVAFISGPYRADTVNGIHDNIEAARTVANKYRHMGYAVICPHMNSAYCDNGDDQMFLDECFALIDLLRSGVDCIVMAPGWMESVGAVAEHSRAMVNGLMIKYE